MFLTKQSGMKKCRLNIGLMGAKWVFVYLLGEMAL